MPLFSGCRTGLGLSKPSNGEDTDPKKSRAPTRAGCEQASRLPKMGSPTPANVLEQRRHGLTNISSSVTPWLPLWPLREDNTFHSPESSPLLIGPHTYITTIATASRGLLSPTCQTPPIRPSTPSLQPKAMVAHINGCRHREQGLPSANVPNAINSPFHTLATAGSKRRL
ncbi:unnamed protein product [Zymoseptoria tritici ST99CH_1E4]|uniref:Uncharacterized protein n=1 Tax=Zymoseptoria tritici ST99CH_1E4 TaxID=1276532 RepID=A0A2H1H9C2_ZYMTR|nr:unnamed protein product [Zymoseptoria tritici ST99CH_1E4]